MKYAVRSDEDLAVACAYRVEMCWHGTNCAVKDRMTIRHVECIKQPVVMVHSPHGIAGNNGWTSEEIGATPGNREWRVGPEINIERYDAIVAWHD